MRNHLVNGKRLIYYSVYHHANTATCQFGLFGHECFDQLALSKRGGKNVSETEIQYDVHLIYWTSRYLTNNPIILLPG